MEEDRVILLANGKGAGLLVKVFDARKIAGSDVCSGFRTEASGQAARAANEMTSDMIARRNPPGFCETPVFMSATGAELFRSSYRN